MAVSLREEQKLMVSERNSNGESKREVYKIRTGELRNFHGGADVGRVV